MHPVQSVVLWSFVLAHGVLSREPLNTESPHNVTCTNETMTCRDIMIRYLNVEEDALEEECEYRKIVTDYSVDRTSVRQPFLNLTFNTPLTGAGDSDKGGLVFGYRDCTHRPPQTCYIPYQLHTTVSEVELSETTGAPELGFGETCELFGCSLIYYTYNGQYCGDIITMENITIGMVKGTVKYSRLKGLAFVNINPNEWDITVNNSHFTIQWNLSIMDNLGQGYLTVIYIATCSLDNYNFQNGNRTFKYQDDYPDKIVAGTVMYVTCDFGYNATYNGTSVCQMDGNWSTPELPSCLLPTCLLDDNSIQNGDVSIKYTDEYPNITAVGTVLSVTCHEGYIVTPGGGYSTCMSDGKWSTTVLPSCIPTCPPPNGTENIGEGTLYYNMEPLDANNNYVVNTTLEVRCGRFHLASGMITCENSREWSGSLPTCKPDVGAITGMVIGTGLAVLMITVSVLAAICRKRYNNYRKTRVRRWLDINYSLQAKEETLDKNYAPIDLTVKRKLTFSFSVETTEGYYGYTDLDGNCVSTPTSTGPLSGPVTSPRYIALTGGSQSPSIPESHTPPNTETTEPPKVPLGISNTNINSPYLPNGSEASGIVTTNWSRPEGTKPENNTTDTTEKSNDFSIVFNLPNPMFIDSSGNTTGGGDFPQIADEITEFAATHDRSSNTDSTYQFQPQQQTSDSGLTEIDDNARTLGYIIDTNQLTDNHPSPVHKVEVSGEDTFSVAQSDTAISSIEPSDVSLAFATVDRPHQKPDATTSKNSAVMTQPKSHSGYINTDDSNEEQRQEQAVHGPISSGYSSIKSSELSSPLSSGYITESVVGKSVPSSRAGESYSGGLKTAQLNGEYIQESSLGQSDQSNSNYIQDSNTCQSSTSGYCADFSNVQSSTDHYIPDSNPCQLTTDYIQESSIGQSTFDHYIPESYTGQSTTDYNSASECSVCPSSSGYLADSSTHAFTSTSNTTSSYSNLPKCASPYLNESNLDDNATIVTELEEQSVPPEMMDGFLSPTALPPRAHLNPDSPDLGSPDPGSPDLGSPDLGSPDPGSSSYYVINGHSNSSTTV